MNKRGSVDNQFINYVVGGGLSAVTDIVVMQLLILSGFTYLVATTYGYILGLVVNFLFHSQLTFSSKISSGILFRFGVGIVINYINTVVFVYIGYVYLGSALAGKIASLPIVTITGFFLCKYWIFNGRSNV